MGLELPDDDDSGPNISHQKRLPAKKPAKAKPPKRAADQPQARRPKPKAQRSSASSVRGEALPPEDDGDVDFEDLFLLHGNPPGNSLLVPEVGDRDQFLAYDSDKLKTAARKIPSQVTMPYSDLAEAMTQVKPVDPNLQCSLWEVYSIPRLGPILRDMGGTCRRSYDLKNFWDLKEPAFQRTLLTDVSILQPRALMLSPPCTWVSMLMHSNWARVAPAKRVLSLLEALSHIDFSMWLASLQYDQHRLFVFEHPGGSIAWERDSVS